MYIRISSRSISSPGMFGSLFTLLFSLYFRPSPAMFYNHLAVDHPGKGCAEVSTSKDLYRYPVCPDYYRLVDYQGPSGKRESP
jgi:hypothetical protein